MKMRWENDNEISLNEKWTGFMMSVLGWIIYYGFNGCLATLLTVLNVFHAWLVRTNAAVSGKDSRTSSVLICLHAFNPANAENVHRSTYHGHMVTCGSLSVTPISHAPSPPPHQDPIRLTMGASHRQSCRNDPTTIPWSYSWGPAAPHFGGSFIHGVTVPMEHGWSVWREGGREGGCPHRTPLCQSCCSAPC